MFSFKNKLVPELELEFSKHRVYRCVNEDNLIHNLNEINKFKQEKAEVMAVVKADAYGHGSVKISKILQKHDVKIFAVATLEEAIELREHHIKGDILILGYTELKQLDLVNKYNLIQTIVDYDYAKNIESLNLKKPLRCHIKINTGMNRLGEDYNNIQHIKELYGLSYLKVLGIFSHLAVADSKDEDDIVFTKVQIDRFNACISQLRKKGINVKKVHLQGSYGLTNYPELDYDYIRMGIMLYGVKSSIHDEIPLDLKPVLTLKAKITSIRTIDEGASVSYGRTYIANSSMRIASVSIGYADGLSRSLSNTGDKVYVNNTACPIIGRICMDQLMIDVSHVYNVKVEDEVIIFGEENSVEILADKQNTITNEVLTSLTQRIEH